MVSHRLRVLENRQLKYSYGLVRTTVGGTISNGSVSLDLILVSSWLLRKQEPSTRSVREKRLWRRTKDMSRLSWLLELNDHVENKASFVEVMRLLNMLRTLERGRLKKSGDLVSASVKHPSAWQHRQASVSRTGSSSDQLYLETLEERL